VEAGLPALARTSNIERRTSNVEQGRGLEALSREETAELKMRESAIEDRLNNIVDDCREMARHMRHIQTDRLYRAKYHTFEAYCLARWNKTGRRIRQFIDFLGVDEDLRGNVNHGSLSGPTPGTALPAPPGPPLPTPTQAWARQRPAEENWDLLADGPPAPLLPRNERVGRALVPLAKEERVVAWDEAKTIAGEGKEPTEQHVARAVQSLKSKVQSPALTTGSAIPDGKEKLVRLLAEAMGALLRVKRELIDKASLLDFTRAWECLQNMALRHETGPTRIPTQRPRKRRLTAAARARLLALARARWAKAKASGRNHV
jgi:hypothetical protein